MKLSVGNLVEGGFQQDALNSTLGNLCEYSIRRLALLLKSHASSHDAPHFALDSKPQALDRMRFATLLCF